MDLVICRLQRLPTDSAEEPNTTKYSKILQIEAIGAAYHRLLLLKPYHDTRLISAIMAYALLKRCGLEIGLWSLARGLVRNLDRYNELTSKAMEEHEKTLSERALTNFCVFFMETCIQQIDDMISYLEPRALLGRIHSHVEDEVQMGNLLEGSYQLLREVLLTGEMPKSRAKEVTGYGDRTARKVLYKLIEKGYLKSETRLSPLVTLAFPIDAVERWFPGLYNTLV